jgi:hypothetical protein
MDMAAIEFPIQEKIKRAILPLNDLKDPVLVVVFVRSAQDHPPRTLSLGRLPQTRSNISGLTRDE